MNKISLDVDLKTGGIVIKTEGYTSVDDYDLFNIVNATEVPESNYAGFIRSRGTIADPKAMQNNDEIFSFFYAGYDSENQPAWSAELTVGSEGNIQPGIVPSYFAFKTVDQKGIANIVFRVNSDKTVGFNPDALTTNVDTSQPSKFLKIKIGNEYYAIPAYLIK